MSDREADQSGSRTVTAEHEHASQRLPINDRPFRPTETLDSDSLPLERYVMLVVPAREHDDRVTSHRDIDRALDRCVRTPVIATNTQRRRPGRLAARQSDADR